MPGLTNEQQQLLDLLRAAYHDIYALEEALDFRVSQSDNRIRVDYFYDAARALTSDALPLDHRRQRLSVEWLAYDAMAIRYLEHHPFAALKPHDMHHAPGLEVMALDGRLPSASRSPGREDKQALKHLYLRFGVMFVALFKPFADRDYRDKQEEMQEQLSTIAQLKRDMEALAMGEKNRADIQQQLAMVDDPKLKNQLQSLLTDNRYRQPSAMREAMSVTRHGVAQQESQLKAVEKAHLNYVSAQLGLYEQGKATVKQLAGQGLNVAGEHLNQALNQSNDMGRGR